MKIYTKKGDKGMTGLIGGTRISKGSLRIEAYGTVDELNSYVGLIRDQEISKTYFEQLLEIQDRLFTIGSSLATDPKGTKMKLPEIESRDLENLEEWMDSMDEKLEPMRSFVLPGGHSTVSFTHIARCVCRRAERIIVDLNNQEPIDDLIMSYMNRLSDYFFVLARALSYELKIIEQPWKPRI